MIDEDASTYYLQDQLDRAHAAMIVAVNGEGEHHELLYHILEALSHDDRERAEGVIPALEFEIAQDQRRKSEASEKARKKLERAYAQAAKPVSPNDSRIRLFALQLVGLLQPVWPGTNVPESLWQRFWKKVAIPTTGPGYAWADDCWLWTGATSKKRRSRRGHIQIGGRGSPVVLACRLICEWWYGPAPSVDHEAGHTCPKGEQALCVNPQHLRWMTREENEQHKQTYDRGAKPAEQPFQS